MRVYLTAHAGAMDTEANTINSLKTLAQQPVDYIEIDVCETKRGQFIMTHDARISWCGKQLALDEIEDVDLFRAHDYPRLDAALGLLSNCKVQINLDLKNVKSYDALFELIQTFEMVDKVLLTGCDARRCAEILALAPSFRLLIGLPGNGDLSLAQQTTQLIAACERHQSLGVNLDYHLCTAELMYQMRRAAIDVYVWTVDSAAEMSAVLALGVAGITTNRLDIFGQVVREWQSEKI